MKLKQKILAVFLSAAMLASSFSTFPTLAAESGSDDATEPEPPYEAAVYDKNGDFLEYDTSVGRAMLTASDERGTIKLLADCVIDTPLNVIGGCTVTLDLNGHTVDRGNKNNMSDPIGSVISLGESANLTIIDTSDTQSGTLTGGGAKWGGGIYAPKDNIVTMNAGTITRCTAYYGGGIYVDESSKFILNGGKIDHCYATYGGGVYVEDKARFETHGGRITNNIAVEDGGGIYVWSAFLNLDKCYIGHNHADEGGGIYSSYNWNKIHSFVTLSGTTVEGNTAQSGYGGIYHKDGSLTLKDGTIVVENSTNGKYGGGVYSEKCRIDLGGNIWIFGNTANTLEPCDVSLGTDLVSAFNLLYNLSSISLIGVNTKYHKPQTWYSDDHYSWGGCDETSDRGKADTLKDALFSNNLRTGFADSFRIDDDDYTYRHFVQVFESGDAVEDSIKVTNVFYKNMPLPQSDYSASYDAARRTIFLRVPKYVKNYSDLDVATDNPNVTFLRGARFASSTGVGDVVSTRFGLVVQNVNDSPSYTVSVEGGTIDGASSAQKEFFDELHLEPVEPEGKMFSHWEVEGDYTVDHIIGYNSYIKIPLYLLMPNGNVKFTAVFRDKVTQVEVRLTSPKIGDHTAFYVKETDTPCQHATVSYKNAAGTVIKEETVDVTWSMRSDSEGGRRIAIHYYDYNAPYKADFNVQDTMSGDFSLADAGSVSFKLYVDGELWKQEWNTYFTGYEYVYGDGYYWRLNNDNNPILQHILHTTLYYRSEKAPIWQSIPSQISVPENTTKAELISLLPESVNVQIADISYSNGSQRPEVVHSPVIWDTSRLPDTVTERIEITGTYNTANEGFEVKAGDDIRPTLIVDPITRGQSQMPQVTVNGTPVSVIDGTVKLALGKSIKLTTSLAGATIYYTLDGGSLTPYTPDTEIEISGEKDAITTHKFEAYATADGQQSDTLRLTLEVDNKTTYTLTIVDSDGSEYIYATGAGEYKLGDTVSFDMTKKFMRNPWKPGYIYEDVEDPRRTAIAWSAKGIVLSEEQKTDPTFTIEMPNSNVIIKIESFKFKDKVHTVTIVDADGNVFTNALGAGQYKENDTVTIDSTKFMLKSVNDDGVETSTETSVPDKVVAKWSAEGIELTEKQQNSDKFTFTMPYNDVTVTAESLRPLIKQIYLSSIVPVAGKELPSKLEVLSARDIYGNVIDKEDIKLEAVLPDESLFNGMWADKETGKMLEAGTIAQLGKTYMTVFGVQRTEDNKAACDEFDIYMDDQIVEPNLFFGPYMISVEIQPIKDELLAVDWSGVKELFYSRSDAKASLASEVKVRTKHGTIDTASVTWDGTSKLDNPVAYGDFPVTATLTLPDYVDDPNGFGTKSFTLKVRKHIDSVALKTTGVIFPARKGNTLPTASKIQIDQGTSTDYRTVLRNVQVLDKNGTDVSGQIAQAGEEYTIKASIVPNTDYAVLSDNTVFTIKDKVMEVIGKTKNTYPERSDVYEVSYTFTAEDVKSYEVVVNGSSLGKRANGNAVSINAAETVGFNHWMAEAVYDTTENVYDSKGNVTGTTTVTHRSPVNPFKDDEEYNAQAKFTMPLLVDDNARLELTAIYSYGVTAYDRETKTATIVADKDYNGAKVVFAAYSGFGRLLSVSLADADLKKGENAVTALADFAVNDDEKLKIMVLNNTEEMIPLFEAFEQSYTGTGEGSGEPKE